MANRTAKEAFIVREILDSKATEKAIKVRSITFERPTEELHGEDAITRAIHQALNGEPPNATIIFTGDHKAELSYDPATENVADLLN